MKVLILGSGVLGVATAYVLAARGHSVEVIDRRATSGAETSFANGGQLSYSHAEPWASPHVLPKLPKWMLHKDSPLIFRPRLDVDMFRWGLKFLANCTTARAERNCMNILRLNLYSRLKMQEMVAATGVAFDYAERGVLHIFARQADLDYALRQAEFQRKFGCEQTTLTRDEVLALEPAMAESGVPVIGGIHSHLDASGDIYKFCVALSEHCAQAYGVKFHHNTTITAMASDGTRLTSVTTDKGTHTADAYVMAMGVASPLFLRGLGINVPIYPMKGYSITVPANAYAPHVSITDSSHKIVFSRLGERLRVAGTAEFAGYDDNLRDDRIDPIVRAARRLFPKVEWDVRSHEWACLRPSTPTGVPILGASPLENLYLNTGHGTLGWTQAAGSAHIVADIIENRPPEIMLGGLTL